MTGFFSGFGHALASSFWLQHQLSLIAFLLVVAAIAVANGLSLRRLKLGWFPVPAEFPRVSVLVPARNEERTIAACVRSLLGQDYPDFEVVVLDDHSTDGTGQALQVFSADPRLRLERSADLPRGWFGKHWACHQLLARARGEVVVFTDADTVHHPRMLRDAVAAQIVLDADLLTALPRERTETFGERLIIPVMPFAIIGFLPLAVAHRVRWQSYSVAVGQFMLFRKSALERIGGYESVRDKQVDDMALVRRVKKMGFRWRLVDGQDRISCRMYTGFRRAFPGFGNTIFAAVGRNIPFFFFIWLWLFTLVWQPLVVVGIRLAGGPVSIYSLVLALAAVAVMLALWTGVLTRFRFPLLLAPCYPLTFLLTLVMAFVAVFSFRSGRAAWKGRKL